MLDTSKLKVGSVVRMEATINEIDTDGTFRVYVKGQEGLWGSKIYKESMQHAELVSTPVTFSAEQIAAIKSESERAFKVGAKGYLVTEEWLDSHEDKSRLE